jgi:hypothetical protein
VRRHLGRPASSRSIIHHPSSIIWHLETLSEVTELDMKIIWITAAVVLLALGGAVGGGAFLATSRAQSTAHAPRATMSLQAAGTPRALTDVIAGAMLEYDPPKQLDLLIVGAKGKGQFTCELRSASKELLLSIQRVILEAPDVSVNCANGSTSPRGGVVIDLDDPRGGSFVLGAQRPRR